MKQFLLKILVVVGALGLLIGVLRFLPSEGGGGALRYDDRDVISIDWRLLRTLDYHTGQMNSDLRAVNQKKVRIPGFMVPLEDEAFQVKEFLLVPNAQACIHVPPPPPHQMIFVRMKEATPAKRAWGPIWVTGVLKIEDVENTFGTASFEMEGEHIEKFNAR